jgi:hypothetical protein
MKSYLRQLIQFAFILTILCPLALLGQTSTSADKTSQSDDSGLIGYLLRTVKLTGSIRERWEATDGPFSVTPADSYLISQERLGITYRPNSWLQFMAEAQDVRVFFYQITPSSTYSNPIDLHQAWVAVGRPEGTGFFVQLGRQDMVIGSGHLLASTDAWWAYTARNFDVANGTWTNKLWKSQFVAGSVVQIDPNGMDEHRTGDHIYANYNTFSHLLPGASVEPYFIARTSIGAKSKDGQAGNLETLALGGRVAGTLPGRFDYSLEGVHEFGSYSSDSLNANGLLAGAGWVVSPFGWKPRVSTDFTYASGDDGKKNGSRETFDNMFGFNFPSNSLTGQFGWRNIKDLRAGVEFSPVKKLKIKLDGRDFWLANTADGLYNPAGARSVFNPAATSGHVGESIEIMATATLSKHDTVGFGVGTLFPGEYLKQSQKDQAFIYPYLYVAHKF